MSNKKLVRRKGCDNSCGCPSVESDSSYFTIRRSLERQITGLQIQRDCKHIWQSHGFGFKCLKCDFYTGNHSDWNERIKRGGDV